MSQPTSQQTSKMEGKTQPEKEDGIEKLQQILKQKDIEDYKYKLARELLNSYDDIKQTGDLCLIEQCSEFLRNFEERKRFMSVISINETRSRIIGRFETLTNCKKITNQIKDLLKFLKENVPDSEEIAVCEGVLRQKSEDLMFLEAYYRTASKREMTKSDLLSQDDRHRQSKSVLS